MLRLRRKYNIAVGVSTSYAFMAIILKRLKFAKFVIYYSIDYYPATSVMNTMFRRFDAFCVRNCDVVWNLSEAIASARTCQDKPSAGGAKHLLVPLTYGETALVAVPVAEIDPWSLGFIGTLEKLQGLELVVTALPFIIREVPKVKVKIVGDGPYREEFIELIQQAGLSDHFELHGFVSNEGEARSIISHCAVGLAPYTPAPDNNAMNADPGKPKFYAFMGLPVIMTRIASAAAIEEAGAGIAIDYDPVQLASAVLLLLRSSEVLAEYRMNATSYARRYTSERIFGNALGKTLEIVGRNRRN